jgi:hypothetical protein
VFVEQPGRSAASAATRARVVRVVVLFIARAPVSG